MSSSPPAVSNVDRGPRIMTILWVQAGISVIIMILRFWARISIGAVGMDDLVMLFTLVNFLVFNAMISAQALHGGDRHSIYIPPDQQKIIVKLSWLGQPFVIAAICFAKISVAFLLLRLIGPKPRWPRYFLYFAMASSLVVTIVDIIFTFVQCSPARALWEPNIPHTCWEPTIQSKFAIFTSSWLITVDAALAILPVFVFGRLKMSVKRKVGICALLGCGIIAAVCGAVKTAFLPELSARSDITWLTYNVYVWSGSEVFVLILCGSVPPLKILYDKCTTKKKDSVLSSSYMRSDPTSDGFPLEAYPAESKAKPVQARNIIDV